MFPRNQGGPLEHVIAIKLSKEALTDFLSMVRVRNNAKVMANELSKNYNLISGGTDNHLMLIDLRNKKLLKEAEEALVKADITANKIWFLLMINRPL